MAEEGQTATQSQNGEPAMAVASAADPSYAEGKLHRHSVNLAGDLRTKQGATVVKDVVLSFDTNIYASGDVLADTQTLTAAFRAADFGGVLQSITVIDKDDQGAAFDIYILDANNSLGTENSAPNISDANAAAIQGRIQIATGDYYDLGGCKVAHLSNLAIPIKPLSGTTTLALGVINGTGTPTYSASGVVLRLGILQD